MFKKRAVLAIIVSIIIAGSTTFGTLMYLESRDYRNVLQSQYERSLYNLVSDVEQIQVSMSKIPVSASQKQSLLMFADVWRQANAAQERLNSLPISNAALQDVSKYLSQVGDFCYALLKAANRGESLTQTEWNNFDKLKSYSQYLSTQIHALEQDVSQGRMDWGEIRTAGKEIFEKRLQNSVETKFEQIAESMQKYPTLIYDGPFSENVLNIKPRVLSEKEISLGKAKEIAANILGKDKVESISQYSDKKGERIPAYALSVKMKGRRDGEVNIDISKNGGHVVYMLDSRDVNEDKIGMKAAVERGRKFLESIGYRDMIPTFSLKYDSTALVNYVYVDGKHVVYPDQIKLKIALDNGDIVGIESQHYLIAHYDRDIPNPRITPEEARKNVSQKLNIRNVRLAVIPMESLREVYCYEFYGDYDGEKYIVYINSQDGNEERILKIMDTPNGELTM
ncbi:germination protein YpeB [Fonticella tunisiensis]|uniref:Germination protein YpeB n=1 Tax=Fonticella tunisiensis TaxID=1096341 RepID=A0A4R7KT80_9CLOT|nr:germination protein YpeB [Fonticella tunisiensis]TDT62349.1 germination protein YpeB [Fonticella tunisiensis]